MGWALPRGHDTTSAAQKRIENACYMGGSQRELAAETVCSKTKPS
jgi:hypothetical protein